MLTHFYGGITRGSAVSRASAMISKYSVGVRKKAAEIIACLGKISGSILPLVLLRAQMEASREKGIIDGQFISKTNPTETKNTKEEKPKNYTIIDHLTDGTYRISYVIVGGKKREDIICIECNIINGHTESCPKHEKGKQIPQQGTIFPRIRG